MNDITDGIEVFLIFLGFSIPVIVAGLVYYFKKRFEHKQIIAAIEKGTPLSDLRPVKSTEPISPLWIKNLTAGIAMLIIAAGLALMLFLGYSFGPPPFAYFIFAVILFAIGVSHLIRGLLQRKIPEQIQPSNQNNINENKKPDDITSSHIS
jgi:sterol desaturase/sphingolipid hydroxylase (fatty acid hydroxylase superfamily)